MSALAVESDVSLVRPETMATAKLPEHRPPLTVRSQGLTSPGQVRPNNEDQFLIAVLSKALQVQQTSLPQAKVQYGAERGFLCIVADGMGGHAGGEQASALAIDSIEGFVLGTLKWFFQLEGREGGELLKEFQQALGQADARLFAESRQHPELHGMGTTLTMTYSQDHELFVVHAGDSRCYLFRGTLLYRLTHDHTMVEEMVSRGVIPPEEAAHHRLRHIITNSVGGHEPGVKVEVHKVHLEPGDRVLLCSDGLTDMLTDDEIAAILQAEEDPHGACQRLVARANEQGGRDNITVIVSAYE